MGACCEKPNTTYLSNLTDRDTHTGTKILLLGTALSGKSTLFKSIQHFRDNCKRNYDMRFVSTIRNNILVAIIELISHSPLNQRINDEELQKHIQIILEFEPGLLDMDCLGPQGELLKNAINYIWKLPVIQDTYYHYKFVKTYMYNMPDNLEYFSSKIDDIFDSCYLVTPADRLNTRIKTTGCIEYKYERYQTTLRIIDIGGTRNERKKWYEHWSGIAVVIYCCALDHFCKPLIEDEGTNAMIESLQLFHAIYDHKCFKLSTIILVLTRLDLFKECLRYNPLTICFGNITESIIQFMLKQYEKEICIQLPLDVCGLIITYCKYWINGEWTENMNEEQLFEYCQQSKDYIAERFCEVATKKSIFCHVVNLTDLSATENVIWDVENIVIRSRRGGLV